MTEKLSKEQRAGIISALDEALNSAPWQSSTFLSLIGKKLQAIRDEVFEQLDSDETFGQTALSSQQLSSERFLKMKKVYVSLYSFDGTSLESWERIIQHLSDQVVSRPVYENEADVEAIIRAKSNRINEGYVAVYVDPTFILPAVPDKKVVDKLGVPLLTLKAKAINLNNVDSFIHHSGQYRFVSGRLIRK